MLISELLQKEANKYGEWSNIRSRILELRYKNCELVLKGCPICGKDAELKINNHLDGNCNYFTAHIQCSCCGLRTVSKTVDGYYGDKHIINDVIDLWNNRPLDKHKER